ncbi:MAG: ATP-binding protein [Terriglobales bacterium]|jgi:signal transduction histidine kinase
MSAIADSLSMRRRTLIFLGCVVSVLIIGWADRLTAPEIGFEVLYLLPIMVSGWYVGRFPTITLCILSALARFGADFYWLSHFSNPLILLWNAGVPLAFYLVSSMLLVSLKQALERERSLLRHADRLATIGQLATGLAHEINEPLANILGFAQLAQKAASLPKQVAGDLGKIVKNCLHAREIITGLLTFARQVPPAKTRISLNQVITDGLYLVDSRCARAGIRIVLQLSTDLPEIYADSSQLHQVLVNLVVNAVQAMPDGGTLTIETSVAEHAVLLIVRDTGAGMSEAVKKNVFTPFFTTKDVGQGTGLGLAVAHGIVSAHGGAIRLESGTGRGTSFEIRLPIGVTAHLASALGRDVEAVAVGHTLTPRTDLVHDRTKEVGA